MTAPGTILAFAFPSGGPLELLLGLWDAVWPIVAIMLGFSLIIFVHELGHFLAAKWARVRVDRFAIGFGKEIFGFTQGETRYSFNWLPFGGYVKMLGQEDFDDKSEELKFKDDPNSFLNKPVGHRMIIVCAGVVMNLLFAFLMFMIVFMVGKEGIKPEIGFVLADSAADRAGLMAGDVIREINGKKIREWMEVMHEVALSEPLEPIEFTVERDGRIQPPIEVIPESNVALGKPTIGIQPSRTREIVYVRNPGMENREDVLKVGDKIVEIAGKPVTDENASKMLLQLAFQESEAVVERPGTKKGEAPRRVEVRLVPELQLYPSHLSDQSSIHLLGLMPLWKYDDVDPRGRLALAGIDKGDVIVSWADRPNPDLGWIQESIVDHPEEDIAAAVLKPGGKRFFTFVRPKTNGRAPGTIQAGWAWGDVSADDPAMTRLVNVRRGGTAYRAGLREGDWVLRFNGVDRPTPDSVRAAVRANAGSMVAYTVARDGQKHSGTVKPIPGGLLEGPRYLVADDDLTVAGIYRGHQMDGTPMPPTPAEEAGIPGGAVITAVGERKVAKWREVIDAFRQNVGRTVNLEYRVGAETKTTPFRVPDSISARLGLSNSGLILSVDGRREVNLEIPTARGSRSVPVRISHPAALSAILSQLEGQEGVKFEYLAHLDAPLSTAALTITPDLTDPWLTRVRYQNNIDALGEPILVRESNPINAVVLGVRKTWDWVLSVYKTIDRIAFSRSIGAENISGPLGIVDTGRQVAQRGIIDLLFFLGILSANLAVINFLPLPIVDGGLMIFLIIEKIKGSPVRLEIQVATQIVGLVLILTAFAFVMFNDVVRMLNG